MKKFSIALGLLSVGVVGVLAIPAFYPGAHEYTRGVLQYQEGRYLEAIGSLERAKEKSPLKHPSIYLYLGKSYEQIGDSKRAKNNYQTAIEQFHGDPGYLKDPTYQSQVQEAEEGLERLTLR